MIRGLGQWVAANLRSDVALDWEVLGHRVGGEAALDAMLDELLVGTRYSQSTAFVVGGALADALALPLFEAP